MYDNFIPMPTTYLLMTLRSFQRNIWIAFITLTIVLNCLEQTIYTRASIDESSYQSIRSIQVDSSGLTLVSFQFNPSHIASEWIDRMFGQKAVHFYDSNGHSTLHQPLSTEELLRATEIVQRSIPMKTTALWPFCSLELLGYARMGDEDPLTSSYRTRKTAPGGNANLFVRELNISSTCYYRTIYENWRSEQAYTEPNFLGVIFYCPVLDLNDCNMMNNHVLQHENSPVTLDLAMILKQQSIYRASAVVSLVNFPKGFQKIIMHNELKVQPPRSSADQLGLCIAMPYTSVDSSKAVGNSAMLREWIIYHLRLGFKLFIYDRDGANADAVNHPQIAASVSKQELSNLVYHRYTIRGLLDPASAGLKYDNVEPDQNLPDDKRWDRMRRFQMQGHDKSQTLTHCRFEAKAVFGIDRVIVADYDEFLYCAPASPSRKDQVKYFRQLVKGLAEAGVDQATFRQQTAPNLTANPRDCIVDHAQRGISVLSCFGSHAYYVGGHSVKSVHIGHKCPHTGYHEACGGNSKPRTYNCLCNAVDFFFKPCSFMHLTTRVEYFGSTKYKNYLKNFNVDEIVRRGSDLLRVMNSD